MMMTRRSRSATRVLAASLFAVALAPVSARAGADEGKALYEQKCKACHSVGGEGGKMANLGGPLDGAASKHDTAWLKEYIADPKAKKPDSKMPKLQLSAPQIDDLIAYLQTLKK
jgi:cytochrome c oxidase subunit II